jgi:radical SAM superfamily enzyme YgiQ (UPF0313 family)
MKILLIDPVITARTLSLAARKKLRKGIGYPGLGLITVAALTPRDIEVKVVDQSVEDIDFSSRPNLVGISIQAPTAPYVYELSSFYRQRGIPVVVGGIHASLNPEEVLPHADSVVIGEAELSWPRLLEDFRNGCLGKLYRAESLADLDSSPLPRRDLLNDCLYQIPFVTQASKGCPYGCEFCSLHAYVGRVPRFRSIENVVREIRETHEKRILFADDNIYCNREYARDLFGALAPLGKQWVAEATWHIAFDGEALTLARRSGCVGLFIGFDTIQPQRMMRKVPVSDEIEEVYIRAIRNIQTHGIAVVAAFVFGLDNDTPSVFDRALRVAINGEANLAAFNTLIPYPGTPIFNRLKEEGRITEWDWSRYNSPNVCFRPTKMTAEELKEGVLRIQRTFYSRTNILKISFKAARKFGWAMGLLSLQLNLAQRRDWGTGTDEALVF